MVTEAPVVIPSEVFDEADTKWVIIEVRESEIEGEQPNIFIAPKKLQLKHDWLGTIIWHVATPGWGVRDVKFLLGSGFAPQRDPARPGCWYTVAAAVKHGTNHYTIQLESKTGSATIIDPVVENDPPPPEFIAAPAQARPPMGTA